MSLRLAVKFCMKQRSLIHITSNFYFGLNLLDSLSEIFWPFGRTLKISLYLGRRRMLTLWRPGFYRRFLIRYLRFSRSTDIPGWIAEFCTKCFIGLVALMVSEGRLAGRSVIFWCWAILAKIYAKKNVLKSKRGVIADEYSYQEPIKIITDDDLTCGFG